MIEEPIEVIVLNNQILILDILLTVFTGIAVFVALFLPLQRDKNKNKVNRNNLKKSILFILDKLLGYINTEKVRGHLWIPITEIEDFEKIKWQANLLNNEQFNAVIDLLRFIKTSDTFDQSANGIPIAYKFNKENEEKLKKKIEETKQLFGP